MRGLEQRVSAITVKPQSQWHSFLPFGVLILLVLASLACVGVADNTSGFVFRKNYTLKTGTQRNSDQAILAYKINLEPGSAILGDATLTGSKVKLNAEVVGDVVVVANRLEVGDTAHVTGDLVVCSKELKQNTGARIDGKLKKECTTSNRISFSKVVQSGWNSWRGSLLFRLSASIIGALLFGALAALFTVIFPRPLVRMSETVRQHLFMTGGVGCFTMLVAIGLTVTYAVSLRLILPLILLPIVMLFWLVGGLLSLIGWIALAGPFGIYVLRLLGMGKQPRMIGAAVGGITLALLLRIWSIFWLTAWVGLLATAVLGSIGLGAVILTRIGTRSYPHREVKPAAVQSAGD